MGQAPLGWEADCEWWVPRVGLSLFACFHCFAPAALPSTDCLGMRLVSPGSHVALAMGRMESGCHSVPLPQ